MGNRSMEDLKDIICRELDEIAEKGEMSAGELDTVYKLIVAKEKLLRIEELEEDLGYSSAGDWTARGSYGHYSRDSYDMGNGGNSYNNYSRYSGARRDGRGRYSRDDGTEMLRNRMQQMMQEGGLNQADRKALEKAMEIIGR